MSDNKLRQLEVPFTYHGKVIIECTEEEYEDDIESLEERAESILNVQSPKEWMDGMEWGGLDFTSADWVEDEEE